MAVTRTYLDYNASAPLLPAARRAMLAALEIDANPSSVHADGRDARRMIEDARRDVAALCAAKPEHVVFTSGATEAASTLLTPDWRMGRAPLRVSRLHVSATDHPCIRGGGRFPADMVETIGVDANGVIDLAALEAALARHDRQGGLPMVAVHAANNETGVVQPMREIARAAKAAGGIAVIDAVQAAGRVSLDISELCADFLIFSSHKIGGPKGAGAIVGASDLMMPVPLVSGGGQEKGHRAGTENLAAIAGFGAAAREALAALEEAGRVASTRAVFEDAVKELVPDAEIYGADAERLCNTVFFAIPGLKAETAQIALDLAGISLSAGSACSSGKVGPSHVLKAMGVVDGMGALRVSIGRDTGEAELSAFREALAGLVARRATRTSAA
ncbi:cysteine desulfurase family protein [Aquamicrobium sp. LC103]|uniref:cysteine desulfurase family protein n=1 Tax=Aquamicrobium sp. LC103 TaxID=1120658 RepID=UPI00063EB782|nr:cysteine desulfurase family protein [Aquamicrobium sp. LC103]TKT79219.1 cysteine desulfurase [Aquamicrobium sp. LC103]